MKKSETIEYIDPKLLKPDPNQPRKNFDKDVIKNMAKTFKTQGIINPLEVDENNILITAEIRWRSSLEAGLDKVPITRLTGLTKDERKERQVIENLHHNALKDVELENAIYEMYLSGKYGKPERVVGRPSGDTGVISRLAETIGWTQQYIGQIIEAKEFRERQKLKLNFSLQPKTTHLRDTATLQDEDRVKVLKATSKGIIKTSGTHTLKEVSKIYKESSKPIQEKMLTGEVKLDEAKEIVEVTKKVPKPIAEALSKGEISLEVGKEAKEIYQNLKDEGITVSEEKIKEHVTELKTESNLDNAYKKSRVAGQKLALKKDMPTRIGKIEQGKWLVDRVKGPLQSLALINVDAFNELTPKQKENLTPIVENLINKLQEWVRKLKGTKIYDI